MKTPVRDFLPDSVPIKFDPGESSHTRRSLQPSKEDIAFLSMTKSTFAGLALIRGAMEQAVITQRNNLCMSSHNEKRDVAQIKSRLAEEKERLKYINRKLAEKTASHDRACDELQRARVVCATARQDNGIQTDLEQIAARKSFLRICEALENSWEQHVGIAMHQLNGWEFKSRRGVAAIEKLTAELAQAQTEYDAACVKIDSELADLEAVLDLLKQL